METWDAIRARRDVRDYEERAIGDEEVIEGDRETHLAYGVRRSA